MLGVRLLGGHVGAGASDLLDGRLSPADEHRARLHLGRCASCAAAVVAEQDARRLLRQSVRSLTSIGPSNDLMAGLLALSLAGEQATGQSPRPSSLSPDASAFVAAPVKAAASSGRRPSGSRRGVRGAVLISTVLVTTVTVAVGSQSLSAQNQSPAARAADDRRNVVEPVSLPAGTEVAWQSTQAQLTMLAARPNLVQVAPASDTGDVAGR